MMTSLVLMKVSFNSIIFTIIIIIICLLIITKENIFIDIMVIIIFFRSLYLEPFLLKLVDSCDVLFIDKISKNLVSYFIGNKVLKQNVLYLKAIFFCFFFLNYYYELCFFSCSNNYFLFTHNEREIWNIFKWMTLFSLLKSYDRTSS